VLDSDLAHIRSYVTLSQGSNSPELSRLFECAIKIQSPSGSEAARHFIWDVLVRFPIETASPSFNITLLFDRDKYDKSTATVHLKRPDLLCWMRSVLVLKGEEKEAVEDLLIAEQELCSKLQSWSPIHFGNLQYMFGYYYAVVETLMRFVFAIYQNHCKKLTSLLLHN